MMLMLKMTLNLKMYLFIFGYFFHRLFKLLNKYKTLFFSKKILKEHLIPEICKLLTQQSYC